MRTTIHAEPVPQSRLRSVQNRDNRRAQPARLTPRLAALAAFSLLLAALSPAAADPLPLQSLDELQKLNQPEAAQGQPFRYRGLVLCFDAEWNQLFLQGHGEVSYFDPRQVPAQPASGDYLEITGSSVWRNGQPALTNVSANIVGRGPLPRPLNLELSKLPAANNQWVAVEATVRTAETSRGRLSLALADSTTRCIAFVMGAPGTNDFSRLMGARVRIAGICTFDPQADPPSPHLIVPAFANIAVLAPPRASFRNLPVTSVDALLTRPLADWTNEPVHLQGTVLSLQPAESLVLKDPTGTVQARILQATPIQPGARIDLWGFLALGNEVTLVDVYFEPTPAPVARVAPPPAGLNSRGPLQQVITTVTEVARLNPLIAAQHIPVRLRGVITFADPQWGGGFIQDETDAVYFDSSQAKVTAGDWVELEGRTASATFAPVVSNVTVRVLCRTNLPAPIKCSLQDAADGHLDSHWAQLEGIVQRLSLDSDHLRLNLLARDGRFHAVIPWPANSAGPTNLIGARVRLRGAVGAELNARNQLAGLLLHVPSFNQVKILSPAPADPFSIPATPASAVATFDPDREAGQRLKLAGTITLVLPGEGFYLQDETGGIHVRTPDTRALKSGDSVEVLGFAFLGEFSPFLDDPLIRHRDPSPLPAPIRTTAGQLLLHGTNDADLVQLDAQLLQAPANSARPQLVLRDGSVIFTAQLLSRGIASPSLSLPPGSIVRITGVCAIQAAENHEPQSFRLLLADPSALKVLEVPSLGNWRYVKSAALILALVAALVLAWIGSLRRQVRSRTDALREKERELSALMSNLPGMAYRCANHPDRPMLFLSHGCFELTGSQPADLLGASGYASLVHPDDRDSVWNYIQTALRQANRYQVVYRLRTIDGAEKWVWEQGLGLVKNGFTILEGFITDITAIKQAELKVEALHKQLVLTSRQAGMAEVATSVLHNVGNVLNSINVSTSLLLEQAARSKTAGVNRLSKLFQEHAADLPDFLTLDPRGRQVPLYLQQLAAQLTAEQSNLSTELASLAKNVDHVKSIIAMQQDYAKVAGVAELVPPAELLEDALRFNSGALARHQILVLRQYDPDAPSVSVDKHKVLQILVNLVRNAKFACNESRRADKRLTVAVIPTASRVRITVTDNGIGIPRENLTRIFSLGFSTRKDGHGFGLHSSAIAALELGGQLRAESLGPGQGATFTLELPIAPSLNSPGQPEVAAPAPLLARSNPQLEPALS